MSVQIVAKQTVYENRPNTFWNQNLGLTTRMEAFENFGLVPCLLGQECTK